MLNQSEGTTIHVPIQVPMPSVGFPTLVPTCGIIDSEADIHISGI
jgi:hypothetical protein